MVSGHTRGVRHKTGSDFIGPPCLGETDNMIVIKHNILTRSLKKHHNFPLHNHKTIDIKPIAKIDVSADTQRHCSTTFYQ